MDPVLRGAPPSCRAGFYVPPAARPLLGGARRYLLDRNAASVEHMFGRKRLQDQVAVAVANCRIPLPRRPDLGLAAAWQMRPHTSHLAEPLPHSP